MDERRIYYKAMKVDVYANLQKECVSIRSRETEDYGTVVDYRPKVTLLDVEFVVQPAGRDRCRVTRTKNVHAFVRGKWDDSQEVCFGEEVTYNPFEYDGFVEADSEQRVESADRATVTRKAVYAKGLSYYDPKVEA